MARNSATSFLECQRFLKSEEKGKLLDELIEFNSKYAKIVSRYFCLNGEERISQVNLARGKGYTKGGCIVTHAINIILTYLEAPPHLAKRVNIKALKKEVARLRMRRAIEEKFHPSDIKNFDDEMYSLRLDRCMASRGKSRENLKEIFFELVEERSDIFTELQYFNFKCAEVASRYFSESLTQKDLAQECGYKQASISQYLLLALKYLCPSFKTNKTIESRVNSLRRRVELYRKKKSGIKSLLERKYGIAEIPKGLKKSQYILYAKVLFAYDEGFLDTLNSWNPMTARILKLRFGLDEEYKCLSQQKIADLLNVSKQNVSLLEKRGLEEIGIGK
ncbi:MAG: sigma factor-like helix-turn-helix DNA-binding protein [bacterium]